MFFRNDMKWQRFSLLLCMSTPRCFILVWFLCVSLLRPPSCSAGKWYLTVATLSFSLTWQQHFDIGTLFSHINSKRFPRIWKGCFLLSFYLNDLVLENINWKYFTQNHSFWSSSCRFPVVDLPNHILARFWK